MAGQDAELRKLYNIRKTVLKTLKDRSYDLPEGIESIPFDDFRILFNINRHHLYFPTMVPPETEGKVEDGRRGVLVYFEDNEDFTKKVLESEVSTLSEEYPNLARLFFVLKLKSNGGKKPKINAFVMSALKKKPEYSYVRILENIYPFDIMDNVVLPKVAKLTTEERDMVVKYLKTPLENFKKIESTDPVASRYGAQPGDVLYIVRYGGLEIDFKVVVEPGRY